jgi:hypothetical protein
MEILLTRTNPQIQEIRAAQVTVRKVKILKRNSEVVNQRTDDTMSNRIGTKR